jgi:hypothetical protein
MFHTELRKRHCALRSAAPALLFLALAGAGSAGAFEQDQRINSLTLQSGTDSFATNNRLGQAFTGVMVNNLQNTLNANIESGRVSLLLEMPGLSDLSGTSVPSLRIGVVNAAPVISSNNPAPYSGSAGLDWWYTADPLGIAGNGVCNVQMNAAIAAGALTATAPEVAIAPNPLTVTGGMLAMSSVILKGTAGGASAPLQSTNGFPPGHLPSEHIDPGLVSFSALSGGQLRGNISAASLAATPYSGQATDQGYTTNNSMLDVIVSGATTLGGLVRLVNPTQPDQSDPNAPVAGAGPNYLFVADSSKKVVGCKDKNGNSVDLTAGLNSAAYSAYFTFSTDRVIAHNVSGSALTPPALSIQGAGTSVLLTVAAQATTTCTIEYRSSLADPVWNWLHTFTGTGGPVTNADATTTAPARLYRARVQ